MFDSSRFRRRLFLRPLEDRLPPGDVLLTGLVTDALGLFGQPGWPVPRAAAVPSAAVAPEWVKATGDAPAFTPSSARDTARPSTEPARWLADDPLFTVSDVGGSAARFTPLPAWVALAGPAVRDTPFTPAPHRSPANTPAAALPVADSAAVPVPPSRPVAGSPVAEAAAVAVEGGSKADDGKADPEKVERPFTRTEILVGVRGDDPLAAIREWAAKTPDGNAGIDPDASKVLLTVDGVSTVEVKLAAGADPLAAVGRFATMPRAAWAEPNYVFHDAKAWVPNDPLYPPSATAPLGQYHHAKSQTVEAWDVTKGTPNIVVAVADDGIGYNHPDLAGALWANPGEVTGDGIDNDNNGYVDDVRGWDFIGNDNNPLPTGDESHGTHVGGIVAARSNNGVGVAGTAGGDGTAATGVRLMNLKWYDDVSAWTATIVSNTLRYAADNGAKVFNASYLFTGWVGNATVGAALDYAYDKGMLVMIAAANSGSLSNTLSAFSQPLFVASLTSTDARSSFSTYGPFVDVSGHGTDILSTTTSAAGTGVNYELYGGTSMSTPHAAGVAALIWSKNPTWTRDQVAAQLLGSADDVYSVGGNQAGTLGSGRVNALRGVTETVAPPVFTVFTTTPTAANPNRLASFAVTAPRRLAPASVTAANFELRSDGADNTFDTADDFTVPVAVNGGAAYRMGTDGLTFTRADGSPLPTDRYRFTAFAGTSKLRDPFGSALDGDANGTAGGDFAREFGLNPRVLGTAYEDANGNAVKNANDAGVGGRTVYLDVNNNSAFDAPQVTAASGPLGLNLPDFSATSGATPVTSPLAVSGVPAGVTDVDVTINVTHTYVGDLRVELIAPDGTTVPLTNRRGGLGDNFTNTVFDDQAATSITAVTSTNAPFTGRYRPESPLNVLNGLDVNGTWTLRVTDLAVNDIGTLDNWAVTFTNAEPNATTDADGAYAVLAAPVGSYTVRTVTPAGWTATGPAGGGHSITVTGPADTFTARDFGSARNDRFYGFVWDDRNANGTQDAGEPPAAGRVVYLDANGNGVFDVPTVNAFTATPALPIPDYNSSTSTATPVTSTQTVSGVVGTVTDLDVTITITHTFVGDLRVELIAPDGTTTVPLVNRRGGGGDNFTNTVFDDAAANPITAVTSSGAPFTNRYRPESPLGVLNGTTANGTWTLRVTDLAGQDTGTLNSWTLTVASGLQEPSVTADAVGNAFLDLPAGASTLRLAPLGGWKFTSPADGKYDVLALGGPLYDRRFGTAEAVPPTVAGVLVGPSAASPGIPAGVQRSRVTALTVTFSERVALPANPADAFTLARAGGGAVPFTVSVNDTGPATVVTLTPSGTTEGGSLSNGRYTLGVVAAQVKDVAQNAMAANYGFAFHRFFGDVNGDEEVSAQDALLFDRSFGSLEGEPRYVAAFDWNGDGDISAQDALIFDRQFGQILP